MKLGKYGIYTKSIKEIYNELSDEEEQLFQIQDRKTYNKIIDEMEKTINQFGFLNDEPFSRYKKDSQTRFRDVYFVIGKWRLGMCEIFIEDTADDVHILCDTKECPEQQEIHRGQINLFINILDKYRNSIIVSKKNYHDIRWKK